MKFQQLMEQYGMIKQEKRLFYPRNFNLSEGFIKALKAEIALQEKSGIDADKFAHKLNRALQFHISEHKKNPSPKQGI
jgi:hypothetical protein